VLRQVAYLAAADELLKVRPAADALQSAGREPVWYAEAQKELVLPHPVVLSAQERRAPQVLRQRAHVEQVLPVLQLAQSRPGMRQVLPVSPVQAPHPSRDVLPVREVPRVDEAQRAPQVSRLPGQPVASPQVSPVLSQRLRRPLLPLPRLATGDGLFRRLQQGWSSSESSSRSRQSPAKDQ
jgi:hypothetical protein